MHLSELKPLQKNPFKSRGDQQIEAIGRSIQEFEKMMEIRKIVIDEDYNILGGNKRYFALKALGRVEIPDSWVDQVSGLTEAQKREFIVKDNAHWGSEWDMDILNDWGVDIEDWGVEVDWELDKPEAIEDDYEMPEEIVTDIVVGDLFEIGVHRLLCGDSTDKEQVERLMGGEKADMVTDPPYGIDINMNMGRRKGQPNKFEKKEWDKSIPDFFYLLPMFENVVLWGGNYFADKLPISKNWLCWYKKTNGLDFGEFELAWTNCDINTRLISHHWSGETKLHPTMKPVSVMAWSIGYVDSKTILDPFLGSGSTMVAAHQLNRRCFGLELEPKYCQVIIDRMRKLDPGIEIKKNGEPMKFTAQ